MSANDYQVQGTHYTSKSIQPWDAMQSWMTTEAFAGFLQGNAIKYLARWKDKGGLDDLKKARHYLDKLIEIETHAADQARVQVAASQYSGSIREVLGAAK
jgi:hypothetical protein